MRKTHAAILLLTAAWFTEPAQELGLAPLSHCFAEAVLPAGLQYCSYRAVAYDAALAHSMQVPVGSTPAAEDLGDRLRRELGAAAVAEDESPLLEVAQRMRQVEGRIVRNDAGPQTQALQRQIVADLDELIRQAQKRCQGAAGKPSQPGSAAGQPKQGRGGMETKPNPKPGATSSQRKDDGQPRKLDKQQMQTLVERLWDVALPPQQRNELRQSPFDEFLPKYELLIEQYYRRLSEEKDER